MKREFNLSQYLVWNIQFKSEKMKAEERLKIYKKALWDYRKGFYINILLYKWYVYDPTYYGLCYYFDTVLHVNVYGSQFKTILPELYAQKPVKNLVGNYWFDPGDLKSRIKCLKKSIKLTKQFINN
jgi:hypothetical protein